MRSNQSIKSHREIVWTIAGSDSGGGAGIQADLHTFQDFGVHGCSVITALTAQNSMTVDRITVTDPQQLSAQLSALNGDLPAKAIKLGMLANQATLQIVAAYLNNYKGFVVFDPVMQSSSGQSLLADNELTFQSLLARIDLLTPNIAEAEALTGLTITSTDTVIRAAEKLLAMGVRSVLITGGHFQPVNRQRVDYWADNENSFWLAGEDIDSVHCHGSGCTLSAAITAAIATGHELRDALILAKAYVTQGIRHSQPLGSGPGPVSHLGFPRQLQDFPRLAQTPDAKPLTFPDCESELGLYPVVDSVEWLEKLMPLGINAIQLRIKDQASDLSEQIQRGVALSKLHQVRLFVNDHWQLAIEHRAYGVHLGQEDLGTADLEAIAAAGLRLGVSTHCYYEIARAHAIEPSYIAIGPIYPTQTKVMQFSERGLERLSEWVQLLRPRYTMTAIGGINLQRAPAVLTTGIKSCAMVTAITLADNYLQVVEDLVSLHPKN